MRTKLSKIALAATLGLALAFTFSCSGGKDDHDGDDPDNGGGSGSCDIGDYKTITIGEQVWMAENLNCNVTGSKCYDNSESKCQKYGRLYDWETALTACPTGWHLPSFEEWETLVDFAGGSDAGKKLKAKSGWNSNGNGTDDYGFSALPGGYGNSDGYFYNAGSYGYWWSATEYNSDLAYYRGMNGSEGVGWNYNNEGILFSVRCLQD
jgi:uncharacterized protein (TIGR02145 family)